LRASRFAYYYIFPFSCRRRRHRFPMGVQSITLPRNAIALARHVYHWSRARSYPPRRVAHRFQCERGITHHTHTHTRLYFYTLYDPT
jgi:hypothetical protein